MQASDFFLYTKDCFFIIPVFVFSDKYLYKIRSCAILLTIPNRFSVCEGMIPGVTYPPTSFFGLRGYDSRRYLPSDIVFRFARVRFSTLLILTHRFSVCGGTIHAFAYPLRSFLGLRGYDSGLCLPSQIVFRFVRVRFTPLLTLPDRFSVCEGTIHAFAYPPRSFFGLRGYDSRRCLPSHIVFRFAGVRFAALLTLPHRFAVCGGKIRGLAYPPTSFFGLRGYNSRRCLPSHIVFRFARVRFGRLLTLSHRFSVCEGRIRDVAYPPTSFLSFPGHELKIQAKNERAHARGMRSCTMHYALV